MTAEHDHFSKLFAESEQALNRFVFSLIPHRADADDILQETMQRLWEHHDDYDVSRPFLPWAYQFAYRQVLQFRRRQAIRGKYFSEAVIESLAESCPKDKQWYLDRQQALRKCLGQLSVRERQLVRERYAGERTIAELSADTNESANAFYKRLQRIRTRLVACITRRMAIEGSER